MLLCVRKNGEIQSAHNKLQMCPRAAQVSLGEAVWLYSQVHHEIPRFVLTKFVTKFIRPRVFRRLLLLKNRRLSFRQPLKIRIHVVRDWKRIKQLLAACPQPNTMDHGNNAKLDVTLWGFPLLRVPFDCIPLRGRRGDGLNLPGSRRRKRGATSLRTSVRPSAGFSIPGSQ